MDKPVDGRRLGWRYADQLFRPAGSYLHHDAQTMDWLYRARALIGAAILVTLGIHYHHAAKDISASFDPILGGVTKPMLLALASVVPATAAVVLFTRPGKRGEAFRQMVRYPVKVALTCLAAYGLARVYERLASTHNGLLSIALILIVIAVFLPFMLFPFRSIYLLTVGMCRLGDGHPLLPPVVGTVVAWVVACQALLAGSASTGEPAALTFAVLVGGPLSITILGQVEVSRLRRRYPEEFPFRDGPLPPTDSPGQAAPAAPSAQTAGPRPFQPPRWGHQQAVPPQPAEGAAGDGPGGPAH